MGLLEATALEKFESFVGVNFFTMIFAWLNILILYIVLKKLLFKPLKNMIDSRKAEIDGMYSDAEEAKVSAEKMKDEYEEKLSAAKSESEEILKNALRRATIKEEEILSDAKKKAERVMERASEEIEQEKRRAINEVKDEVSDIAVAIASAVIERDVNEKEHHDLIDDFIDKIGEAK